MDIARYRKIKEEFGKEIQEVSDRLEEQVIGLPFRVLEDLQAPGVVLIVTGEKPERFLMKIQGARDLAEALRKAANRVERQIYDKNRVSNGGKANRRDKRVRK